MSQLGNSIRGFQYTTFLQRLLKRFQTAMIYKSPSHKKRQKHFQKFSSQTGSRPNANNQLAGVTSLYQTSRLVTRLLKNEMFHSNSYTKSSCNTEQHGTSCSISKTVLRTEMSSHSSKPSRRVECSARLLNQHPVINSHSAKVFRSLS